jgi:hypothetical protein
MLNFHTVRIFDQFLRYFNQKCKVLFLQNAIQKNKVHPENIIISSSAPRMNLIRFICLMISLQVLFMYSRLDIQVEKVKEEFSIVQQISQHGFPQCQQVVYSLSGLSSVAEIVLEVSLSDITSLPILSSFYFSSVLYILKNNGKLEINRVQPFKSQGQALTQVSLFNPSHVMKQEDSFYPDIFKVGRTD